MRDIKFSIITVCLNSDEYIEETILSIANQTYENKEHIIIDGASKDSTLSIIKKHSRYISYFISEPDNGIADAMNKGILQASGDYLIFINSDDYLSDNNVLESIAEYVNENLDYYIFKVVSINPDGTLSYLPNRNMGFLTYFKMGSCHQGHVISRKLFEEYGVYDCSFRIGMDYDFVLRVFQEKALSKSIDLVISKARQTGISSRKDWEGLKGRFLDEKKAHEKNCNNVLLKAIYPSYWFFYLFYRKARYLLSNMQTKQT